MRYLVFVDFDGVLTNNRMQFGLERDAYIMWSIFDPAVIEFFNKIDRRYDNVSFVWSTSWRNGVENDNPMNLHWAYSMWYNAGFRGHFGRPWKIDPDNERKHSKHYHSRAMEIKDYLDEYGENTKDFLILDDTDFGFNEVLGKKRFVKTDSANGMLFKHYLDAWALTGDWDIKV